MNNRDAIILAAEEIVAARYFGHDGYDHDNHQFEIQGAARLIRQALDLPDWVREGDGLTLRQRLENMRRTIKMYQDGATPPSSALVMYEEVKRLQQELAIAAERLMNQAETIQSYQTNPDTVDGSQVMLILEQRATIAKLAEKVADQKEIIRRLTQ